MRTQNFGFLILAVGLVMLASCAHEENNPWRQVTDPYSSAQTHIYGTVTAGCIAGAESLQPTAQIQADYILMRPSRRRFYAHPLMERYIAKLSRAVFEETHEYLLVGDVAQPRGGPFGQPGDPSSHNSHQIGIDADIWYDTSAERLKGDLVETKDASVLVMPGGEKMSPQWNYNHVALLLKKAASFPEVERIFVNPAIKRELCIQSRLGAANARRDFRWLHKLRPWYGHDDHFHVRLTCPSGEDCRIVGDPVPAGDGCDETLNWWFSSEAKAKTKEKAPVFRMPRLPAECAKILPSP